MKHWVVTLQKQKIHKLTTQTLKDSRPITDYEDLMLELNWQQAINEKYFCK